LRTAAGEMHCVSVANDSPSSLGPSLKHEPHEREVASERLG
jgi:hypothetical protein